MKEKNEDNNQIITNFMEISKIEDKNLAIKFLLDANWNESQALNNYFNNKDNNNFIKGIENNSNKYLEKNKNIQNYVRNNSNNTNNDNEGFFCKYIISPIMSLFSSCTSNLNSDYEDDSKIFHFLPNKVQDFSKFNQFIKKYLGIIILYDKNNLEFLKGFINQICRNTSLMNILQQNCIIFPILSSSPNGYRILDMYSDTNILCPSILFCHNNSELNIFDKDNILEIVNGEFIIIHKFYNILMTCLEKINKEIKLNRNMKNEIQEKNNDDDILTDGELLQKQKKDMEELEKNVQNMEEQIKSENDKKKEIFQKIEKNAEKFKKKFEIEPNKDNKNCCTICFRYPDGEKRIDRRFLKTDKIKDLYEYVESLGKDIYSEDGEGVFSLYQPFPPKKYENMENTLENEGLFPNAVIQIKEE